MKAAAVVLFLAVSISLVAPSAAEDELKITLSGCTGLLDHDGKHIPHGQARVQCAGPIGTYTPFLSAGGNAAPAVFSWGKAPGFISCMLHSDSGLRATHASFSALTTSLRTSAPNVMHFVYPGRASSNGQCNAKVEIAGSEPTKINSDHLYAELVDLTGRSILPADPHFSGRYNGTRTSLRPFRYACRLSNPSPPHR